MSKKTLLTSVLSLILCFGLIAGSTFALFTSEAKTDITVTSGKVDVDATIAIKELYTPKAMNDKGEITDAANIAGETLGLGGTAKVETDGSVTIDKMAPGDKVTLEVTMENKSNVDFMQRMVLNCTDADKAFFNELLIGVGSDLDAMTYYTDFASAWESNATVYGEATTATRYITIEMPGHVGDKFQGETCNLTVNVMAVQGNATTVDSDSVVTHMVNSDATLDAAVASAKPGDTIYVTKAMSEALTLDFADDKEIIIRGYHLDQLTVNAPAGTVHVYNNITTLEGDAVAMESLHVYGEVGNAVMKQGRLVVENNAVIKEAKLAPAVGADVAVIIPEPEANAEIGVVEKYVVDEIPEDATASIRVPAGTETDVSGAGKDDVTVGTSSPITDAATLLAAVKNAFDGESLKLAADITIYEALNFDNGGEYTIDLCGYTLNIISTAEENHDGMVVTNGSTLNLTNSVANEGTYNFDCGKSSDDAIYINNTIAGLTSTVNIKNPVKLNIDIQSGCAIHAIASSGNAVVNIDIGTNIMIEGQTNHQVGAIILDINSTLNMKGGELTIHATFDDNYDSWNRDACGIVLRGNNVHAYLTGGTFKVVGKNAFAQGIQIATVNGKAENTDFVIENAVFDISNTGEGECYPFAIFDPTQGSGRINNATVSGNLNGFTTTYYSGTPDIKIYGGTFSVDPTDYLAEGYTVVVDNGIYTVVKADAE